MSPEIAEEARKNPKRFNKEWTKELERVKQVFCSPTSKERVVLETKMHDPETSIKMKSYYQQVLTACAEKDPKAFLKRLVNLARDKELRTCGLYVDYFTLDFKKVGEGQWLYQQETPGLLSKVIKVYELTKDDIFWTLSETRVPTAGSEEKTTRTVWSWENTDEYELPCEFISHGLIEYPPLIW